MWSADCCEKSSSGLQMHLIQLNWIQLNPSRWYKLPWCRVFSSVLLQYRLVLIKLSSLLIKKIIKIILSESAAIENLRCGLHLSMKSWNSVRSVSVPVHRNHTSSKKTSPAFYVMKEGICLFVEDHIHFQETDVEWGKTWGHLRSHSHFWDL